LIGKPEGKRPFRIIRGSREDNIKIHLTGIGREDVDCFIWLRTARCSGSLFTRGVATMSADKWPIHLNSKGSFTTDSENILLTQTQRLPTHMNVINGGYDVETGLCLIHVGHNNVFCIFG
jgi:hypothetical protein